MKNRRTALIAFLLIATLTFGIGYAALTDQLTINGTGNISKAAAEATFDEHLYFSDAQTADAKDSATVAQPDVAGFTVASLAQAGDSTTFTFTITNDGDLDALVTPMALSSASNTAPDYFHMVSDWNGQPRTIPAGTSETYTLTVTVLETPQDTLDASFQITFNATSVDPAP